MKGCYRTGRDIRRPQASRKTTSIAPNAILKESVEDIALVTFFLNMFLVTSLIEPNVCGHEKSILIIVQTRLRPGEQSLV